VSRPVLSRAAGVTLAEALVALALLAVGLVVALGVFGRARASFDLAENRAECQQAVRSAFRRLVREVRAAGLRVNPDGDPGRPDEAVEAAFDTAVVLRADLDARDPARRSVPEATLAGGRFDTVDTGNDEIVAYVLAKPDRSSPGRLAFEADVIEAVRDGDVEAVTIPDVALVQDDPPYTLYRIHLNPGGPGPFVVRTPVVDHVRRLTFRYFDGAGAPLNPTFDTTRLSDDIGGSESSLARATRARIRRIEIELEGLTADAAPGWLDPGDPDPATRGRRKFRLGGAVSPPNLGWTARRDG
jgi:type II secretory pathway pseudopilin PulG